MTQYTLLDPLTGASKTLYASELTRNLTVNVILLREDEHIGIITHRDLVSFCRWCAGRALSQCQTVLPEARAALELVDKWLLDPDSVSNEELNRAAETARAARNVARAARAAAGAADVSFEAQARWLVEHLRSAQ